MHGSPSSGENRTYLDLLNFQEYSFCLARNSVMATRILFYKNALTTMSACEGVDQCYIRSGCKLTSFFLFFRICSYNI